MDPTLGKAHAALAGLYQANWLGAEAEQAFQRAYQLSPNDADVVMLYGRFKRYRGEYDESIRLNRRSVELDPNHEDRRNQLAFAYRFAKDHAAAASAFRTAIEFSPTDVAAHINLASAEAALGNLSEAIRGLQLVEQFDLRAYRLPQMALVYKQARRPEEAARLFSEFEQKADDDSVDEGAWVRAYIAVGDYEQALQRLESAFDNRTLIDVATLTELATNLERFHEFLGSKHVQKLRQVLARFLGSEKLTFVPHDDGNWHIEGETILGPLFEGPRASKWCRERDLNSHTVASTGF